jgi:ribosomal protein S18 acetylase RimI-like enzyme
VATEYRAAEKADCTRIAELIHMASDGVVEFLFHDLVPDMTATQMVAYNLENSVGPHSYKSAIVAVDGDKVVGMALSYPSSYHKITDEMKHFFPADRLEHLHDYYSTAVPASWFLDALGTDAAYRRKGIATQLVELTWKKAIKNNYNMLSLIAFADNAPALTLYEKLGFKAVANIQLAANAYIPHSIGCLLLTSQMGT